MRLSTASLLLLLLTFGCAPPRIATDPADLRDMPQPPSAYLDENTADAPLWPDQQALAEDYLARLFAPWEEMPPQPPEKAFWPEEWMQREPPFAENLRPASPERLDALLRAADRSGYPSLDLPAITVRPTDCRALPTRRPLFRNPALPGQGFPFDRLQHSAVPANTPLRIRHRTPDGAWVYAETAALFGWFPAEDVALAGEDVREAFRSAPLVVLTRDSVPVRDAAGAFRFPARLGTLFPLVAQEGETFRVLVATAAPDGRALLREALLPAGDAAPFPLEATPRRMAELADRMMSQTYAWGDAYGDRDCSSTVRDLFAPFGVWLPRNSSRQAQAWRFIDAADLTPPEKERLLLHRGVPWRTLVWMDGHIMLYLGEHRGRAAVLHTLWGLRTRDTKGREGRRIVGHTVITTLQPGREMPDLAPEGDLRGRIRGIAFPGEERN